MEIKKSKNRFLSILFIVALGAAFFSGIQSSAPDMRLTGDSYFDESKLMDLRVISTLGLTQDDLDALGAVEGVSMAQGCYMEDVYCGEGEAREVLHVESLPEGVNELAPAEGRLPESTDECFLDAAYALKTGYQPGDTLEISVSSEEDSSLRHRSFTVSGYGYSPCYISFNRGSTSLGTGSLAGFMYVVPEEFDAEVYSVAYLHVEGAQELTEFTDGYDSLVETVCGRVEGIADARCEVRYNEVMETAQSELDDAKQEVADGKQELADAKQELEDGKREAESELAEAESELLEGEQELEDGKKELADAEQEAADGEQEIADGEREIEENAWTLEDGRNQLAEARNELNAGEKEYSAGLKEYEEQAADARAELDAAREELEDGKSQYQRGRQQYEEQLAAFEEGQAQLTAAREELLQQQALCEEGRAQLAAGRQQYESGLEQVAAGWEAYNSAAEQLEGQRQEAESAMAGLQSAYESAVQAQQECDARAAQNRSDCAALQSQLEAAQGALASAQAELDALRAAGPPAQEEAVPPAEPVSPEEPAPPEDPESPEYQEELAAYQQKLSEYQQDYAAYQQGMEEYHQKLDRNQRSLAEYQQRLDAAQQAADAQSAAAASLQEKIAALEGEYVGSLQPEQQQKQAAAAAAGAALNSAAAQMEESAGQLTQAEAALEEQRAVLENTEAELARTGQELSAREAELVQAAAQIEAGWQSLGEQEAQAEAGRAQLAQAGAELEATEQELASAQMQLDQGYQQLEEELRSARAELSSARRELDSGWAQLVASQGQISDGDRQLAEGRQSLADAKDKLAEAREEIADAHREIEENEQKLEDGWKDYEEGKKEADEEIAEAEQKIKDAEKELADAEEQIADAQQKIDDIRYPEWYVDDRSVLPEHAGFGENADRLSNIAKVVPILFFLVAALISLTTMTRMVEEERTQIGTLKALGYSKAAIASKYLKYAFWATMGGSVLGILAGEKVLPWVIINAYAIMYQHIPSVLLPYNWTYGLIAMGAALLCTIGATVSSCFRELVSVPAQLMRPPAPKEGKRVWLERIPVIWRRLSFTWKSTVRNLFRYKKRFLMTVIGIGGCMGLLLVGYGLQDSIMDIGRLQFDELQLYDAIVVLDTEASGQELARAEDTVRGDERVTQWKRFFMQMEDVQTDGITDKSWSVYVYVPEDQDSLDAFFSFRDRETKEPYSLTDEGAIITEKIASELGVEPGGTIVLRQDEGEDVEIPILAVCENYLSHYLYMTPALYEKVYGKAPEYNSIFLESGESQEVIEEIGETILEEDAVLNVTYTGTLADQIDHMLGALDVVMVVLIVSAGMLAFVVLYNLNNININERRRELATLKVLGFFDGEVAAYVYRENILLTLIGAGLGVFLGKLLHAYVITTVEVDACMFGRNINLASFVYGTLFTVGFSMIVNAAMYFKLKKIDMVESLKSIE